MGGCLSKGKDSDAEHNAYRHVHNHKTHEPLVNQSRARATTTNQPEKRAASNQNQMVSHSQIPWKPSFVSAPSRRPVIKQDTNTILGKQFEDVKQFYTLGKELGRGQFGVTYLSTENSTGLLYACKSIKIP